MTKRTASRNDGRFVFERIFARSWWIVGLVAIVGCQSVKQPTLSVSTFRGRPIADLIKTLGFTPVATVRTANGLLYTLRGKPVTVSLPAAYGAPAVSQTGACTVMAETDASDTIIDTSVSGPCG